MLSEELLKKLSEPADLAVFLLGFALGFIGSSVYLTTGPPPGTLAGVIGVACLGAKKGADSWLLRWRRKRRLEIRLRDLRKHFEGNSSALRTIESLNAILNPPLIDFDEFERLLNERLQIYIDRLVETSGGLADKYTDLLAEFKKFHRLAENPESNKDELAKLWTSLDDRYFHVATERKALEAMRREKELPPPI